MHRVLIGVVVAGALIIAGIGFAGSYAAVRALALKKGFGNFSYVFPVGIDAGICVLLALDLLLTWMRIPFPMLRQTAWLLTAATIAFNGAAAWPDPLGVGMHAVIPILFVVAVEAARHAVGRIADITADKHMEGVRITRWLLSPVPTFLLWRRMKLWELRSYEQVIKLEQERLVYQARLHSRFGRAWRRKAPVESLMPLRLARYGVPLTETAPAGLAAAGIEAVVAPPVPVLPQPVQVAGELQAAPMAQGVPAQGQTQNQAQSQQQPPAGQFQQPQGFPLGPEGLEGDEQSPWFQGKAPGEMEYQGGYDPAFEPVPDPQYVPDEQYGDWYEEQPQEQFQQPSPEETGSFPIPVGPNRTRELGEGGGVPEPDEEDLYQVFRQSIDGSYPTGPMLAEDIQATYGITMEPGEAKGLAEHFQQRHMKEMEEDHIA
ncbi:DUF2637 domain-containing protein [Streptomyces sp. SID4985]|uniref:DUF2637 domain-containing protein n=1 Tax=Streptomyces sp. SID4985 TaxID=2690292 RepID=UPI001371E789|nr:DUF2637 domain-containing protein [Streptomyces sp. SID4985]MYQ46656.1 DUF2637 domain-containing protein [Streptomyces sp. SID4985]